MALKVDVDLVVGFIMYLSKRHVLYYTFLINVLNEFN